jgi:autotransporter passenger strand-loop-strand repeat protein
VGKTVIFTVAMSEAVTVSGGIPTPTLNDGGAATYNAAATAALGDPTKLVFDYTVSATDHSVTALAIEGINPNGAVVQDGSGHSPDYSGLATTFQTLHVVATPVATVTSVVASAGGVARIGQMLTLTVAMSKAVTVSGGTPTLALNDGGTAVYDPTATKMLGDPTKLVFDYTVSATDQSVKTLAVTGYSLNGAAVQDTGGNSPDFSGLDRKVANLAVEVFVPARIAYVSSGTTTEIAGGTGSYITVLSGGLLSVDSGVRVDHIQTCGTTHLGGTAIDTVIGGGTEIVEPGGSASTTTVDSGGTLELFGGATASGTTVKSGGTL